MHRIPPIQHEDRDADCRISFSSLPLLPTAIFRVLLSINFGLVVLAPFRHLRASVTPSPLRPALEPPTRPYLQICLNSPVKLLCARCKRSKLTGSWMLTNSASFADVHYYFSPPAVKPAHHRFDKRSYVYLYHDAMNRRGRLEIANSAGTPEQDAFMGCTLRYLRY